MSAFSFQCNCASVAYSPNSELQSVLTDKTN